MFYSTDNIVVFPSSNATDKGKRLSEHNISGIVTSVTERNYKLFPESFAVSDAGDSFNIAAGEAVINGYRIKADVGVIIMHPLESGKYLLGIRLKRDVGTQNVLADFGIENVGVEVGAFAESDVGDLKDFLLLNVVKIEAGNVVSNVPNENSEYRISKSLYAKSSGGIKGDDDTIYTMNQNLKKTDDVEFNSVLAGHLKYKDNGTIKNVDTEIKGIQKHIKAIRGTGTWEAEADSTINKLHNDKFEKSEVVTVATPNKVLQLNAQSKLPCDITGNARTADSAIQAEYASHVGNKDSYFDINQNLRKTDAVTFKSVSIDSTNNTITAPDNSLTLNTAKGIKIKSNSEDMLTVDDKGNVVAAGTIRGTRVYNAVWNDYAEFYEKDNTDEVIQPGDVVEINPDNGKVRLCTSIGSNMVIGVCSNTYGHILGGENLENMEDNHKKFVAIGLAGRVYVNVETGVNIQPGQLIIGSFNGKAMTAAKVTDGTVVGKAIGKVEKIDGVRKILMQIMLR